MHTECREIVECHATTFSIDLASCGIVADDLDLSELMCSWALRCGETTKGGLAVIKKSKSVLF